MARKDDLGRAGEQLAVDHLTALGWRILARNWRCSIGEIDIVALDGTTTVVVEVKTRSGVRFGHPLEAVTPIKLARLRRLAGAWCAERESACAARAKGVRIDVLGVVIESQGAHTSVSIEHVRQAG